MHSGVIVVTSKAFYDEIVTVCSAIVTTLKRLCLWSVVFVFKLNNFIRLTRLWSIFFLSICHFYPVTLDQAGFNVKPVTESKKRFSGKFIGRVDVPRPTGKFILSLIMDCHKLYLSDIEGFTIGNETCKLLLHRQYKCYVLR